MEFIEKHDLRKIHFLYNITLKEFNNFCGKKFKNDDERIKNFHSLKDFCKTIIKTRGEIKRVYSYSLQTPLSVGGRLYCGNSIQGLKKVFRGFLMDGITTDIDMKNCHPVILSYICHKHFSANICPRLDEYIRNRDAILNEYPNREKAKSMFLKAVNDNKLSHKKGTDFFKKFDKEMKHLQNIITELECYSDIKNSVPDDKKYNWNGSAINRILCSYENKILQSCINAINRRNLEIFAPFFDGIMPYGNFYGNQEFLEYITNYVENDFKGLNMEWAYKEHDSTIKIPYEWEIPNDEIEKYVYVNTDDECAKYILSLLGNNFIYTRGQMFYKNGNLWINNLQQIEAILTTFITKNSPLTDSKTSHKKWADYKPSQNVLKIIFALIQQNPNDELYDKFHTTTKGKIAFKDGVLCALTNKFYSWNEISFEYYTTIIINRDFKEYLFNADWDLMQQIKEIIFDPLFGNDCELALQFLSRALLGHTEDKNWATFVGNRDCGKGVFYELVKYSFEDYVSTFNIQNILVQRENNNKETSKDLYWLLDLEFVRLAISQENPKDSQKYKISGELQKKICSGGDTLVARRNYDRKDTHFKTDASLFSMGNDFLECNVADCNEHRIQLNSVKQFKTKEQIEELKKQNLPNEVIQRFGIIDTTLKDKCRSAEWKNAFMLLIMRYYKNTAPLIKQNFEDDDDSEKPLIFKIYEKLEITGNQNDIVLVSELEEIFYNDKKKVELELKNLGVVKKKNKSRGVLRDKWCYYGLKIKVIEGTEDDN